MASLTNLRTLYLWGNDISDLSPLVANGGLGEGDEIRLGDNSLDLSEGSEDMDNIRQLQARGVTVYFIR